MNANYTLQPEDGGTLFRYCSGNQFITGVATLADCLSYCGGLLYCDYSYGCSHGYCHKWNAECNTLKNSGAGCSYKYYKYVDCNNALVDASFSSPVQVPFNQGGSMKTVINSYENIFTHNYKTDCLLDSCELKE